jgi:hypothetical protein
MGHVLRVFLMGITATVAIDLWVTFANRVLGWPRTHWGLVGRWIGHMPRGQFAHASIGSAPPVFHEPVVGWVFHYVVGCMYAALYVMFGLVTILSPWFLMQPALGLGLCASKAPRANLVRLQNLIIHCTFGTALFYSYRLTNALA